MESSMMVVILLTVFANVGSLVCGQVHDPDYVRGVTFNTGLYDFSPEPDLLGNNRQQRLQAIIEALRNSRADFVCLQEVWFGEDVEAIVNQLSDVYGYSFSPIHNPDGSLPPQTNVPGDAPCRREPVVNLEQCSRLNNCTSTNVRLELACSAERCPAQLFAVLSESQACVTCIGVSSETAPLAVERCSSTSFPTANPRRMNTDGLALLSKRPLTDRQAFKFHPGITALIDRGYISAKFDQDLDVVCTHLTAMLSGINEPFLSQQFPTYADQNRDEVNTIIGQFGHVTPLVLLGDMNIGEAFTNQLEPNAPNTYKMLKRAFDTTVPARTCTYCTGDRNPYNVNSRPTSIDHVFGNGIKIVASKVVFGPQDVNVTDGQGRRFPLSDHFGVETVFRYPCAC